MKTFIWTPSSMLLSSTVAFGKAFRFCASLDANSQPGQCEVLWMCPGPGEPGADPKGSGCKPARGPAPSFILSICGADLGGGNFDCSKPVDRPVSYDECVPIRKPCNSLDNVCRAGTCQFPGDGKFTITFGSAGTACVPPLSTCAASRLLAPPWQLASFGLESSNMSVVRSGRVVCGAFVLLSSIAQPAFAETYYGRNYRDEATLRLLAPAGATTSWSIFSLPSLTLTQQGTLAPLETISQPLGSLREFKLVTSRPLLAILGHDQTGGGASYFYPQADGRKFWGNAFHIYFPTGTAELIVYVRDDAKIDILDAAGTLVVSSPNLKGGQRWLPPTPLRDRQYTVKSTTPAGSVGPALIAVQLSAVNGYTAVPPVPTEANGLLEDCNNDVGTRFMFGTRNFVRGSLAVFNPSKTTGILFSLTTLTETTRTPTAGYTNLVVQPGQAFGIGPVDLGNQQYELVASGPVTVWAGDLESGSGIADMGDDTTSNFGARGREFLTHSQTQGATVFAFEANTEVTFQRSDAGQVMTSLNTDEFLELSPGDVYSIVASRPVSVQTFGGGVALNDWGTPLRPAQSLDTDGNGLSDFLEGGSCRSSAIDSDGDARFDFEDTDDDNDCVSDSADSNRLLASVPSVNANLNCVAPNNTCDRSTGLCVFVAVDAGVTPSDAGQMTGDAGQMAQDAGVAEEDAGADASVNAPDGGQTEADASFITNPPGMNSPNEVLSATSLRVGCGCDNSPSGFAWVLACVFAVGLKRRLGIASTKQK